MEAYIFKLIKPKHWNSSIEDGDYWKYNHNVEQNIMLIGKEYNIRSQDMTVDQYFYGLQMSMNKK